MSPVLLSALAAGGLTDIDKNLFVWTLVLFALFAFIMGKFAWGPLLQAVEDREKSVRDSVEGAHRSHTEAQALLAQHKEMLREAGKEREEIIKRALREAEQIKADLHTKAREESEQMIARAKDQIDRQKAQAIQELRGEVAELAMGAASRIVASSLTKDAQKKLVDEFIAGVPRA
jgi:F-type H+-transporting ATPase subunit b